LDESKRLYLRAEFIEWLNRIPAPQHRVGAVGYYTQVAFLLRRVLDYCDDKCVCPALVILYLWPYNSRADDVFFGVYSTIIEISELNRLRRWLNAVGDDVDLSGERKNLFIIESGASTTHGLLDAIHQKLNWIGLADLWQEESDERLDW